MFGKPPGGVLDVLKDAAVWGHYPQQSAIVGIVFQIGDGHGGGGIAEQGILAGEVFSLENLDFEEIGEIRVARLETFEVRLFQRIQTGAGGFE
ncbi:hypothetical protein TWF506_003253 [Arthrobotrys conoides]|uniref:Uncharacterized protein n=1 Tax=Arthrobotrys conoides TaxID=74498 RepID=A0AAN8N8L4_9PEZI